MVQRDRTWRNTRRSAQCRVCLQGRVAHSAGEQEWEDTTMMTLVPIDGSQSSVEALKYAARRRPKGQLLVLHVAPSGKPVDLDLLVTLIEETFSDR